MSVNILKVFSEIPDIHLMKRMLSKISFTCSNNGTDFLNTFLSLLFFIIYDYHFYQRCLMQEERDHFDIIMLTVRRGSIK